MESVRLPAGKLVNFLFLQTKTIREALGRKEQLMGKISCFLPTGAHWTFCKESCTIVR